MNEGKGIIEAKSKKEELSKRGNTEKERRNMNMIIPMPIPSPCD